MEVKIKMLGYKQGSLLVVRNTKLKEKTMEESTNEIASKEKTKQKHNQKITFQLHADV